MGIFKRIRNLWNISGQDDRELTFHFFKQKAEFIMPDRVSEILSEKPNPTIDDVIIKA